MYNFWESTIFAKKVYSGKPLKKHLELAKKHRLNQDTVNTRSNYFYHTVDILFNTPNAKQTKIHAQTIRENLERRTGDSMLKL